MLQATNPQEKSVAKQKGSTWYGEWEEKYPKKVLKHNSRGLKALEYVRDQNLKVEGVVEYFGGTGNHSRQIQQVLKPEWHVAFDLNEAACTRLRGLGLPLKVFREEFSVATARELYPDLVVMDSHNFTLMKLQEEHRVSLDRIFARQPAALMVNDLAGEYFWMIRKAYALHLGVAELSYEDYVHFLNLWFLEEFDYGMRAYWHGAPEGSLRPGPGVFVLLPGESKPVIHPKS